MAVPASAGAQPATPTTPTAPTQPATGPGSLDYDYDHVIFTEHGEGAGGYLLFEPADPRGGGTPTASAPLPIVLFFSACCETDDLNDATDNGAPWRAWIDHLVRRGAVVVYPLYDPADPLPHVATAVRSALAELEASGHPPTDPSRLTAVGHSFGAVLAVQYAAIAAERGTARADRPDADHAGLRLLPPARRRGSGARGDAAAGRRRGRGRPANWGASSGTGSPRSRPTARTCVEVRTDRHGAPPLIADHGMPATDVFGTLDALDWFGTWKLLDALMACSFDGTWCEYALGNTAEQRFIGVWSDGVPVLEPTVTDDPGPP